MVLQNEFLLRGLVAHNQIIGNCFCPGCRNRRLALVLNGGFDNQELYGIFMRELVIKEDERLEKLFKTTLQQIVYGKAYKDSSLENTHYKKFGWWAKAQPNFRHLPPKELKKFSGKVNDASNVFESWDTIVRNLTDSRMDQIDARRFSVRQSYLAKSIDCCLSYNESLRKKGKNEDGTPYPEDKYKDILQYVFNSGILDDIDNNPQLAAIIGGRLQSDMVRRSRARYRPY